MTDALLAQCRAIAGDAHVFGEQADMAPFLTDWRGRFTGRARAVVLPANTEQVAAVVRACAQAGAASDRLSTTERPESKRRGCIAALWHAKGGEGIPRRP